MSNPCHIELILSEKEEAVKKPEEEQPVQKRPKKVSKKKLARERMRNPGGGMWSGYWNKYILHLWQTKFTPVLRQTTIKRFVVVCLVLLCSMVCGKARPSFCFSWAKFRAFFCVVPFSFFLDKIGVSFTNTPQQGQHTTLLLELLLSVSLIHMSQKDTFYKQSKGRNNRNRGGAQQQQQKYLRRYCLFHFSILNS